jgi:hypothetical protein
VIQSVWTQIKITLKRFFVLFAVFSIIALCTTFLGAILGLPLSSVIKAAPIYLLSVGFGMVFISAIPGVEQNQFFDLISRLNWCISIAISLLGIAKLMTQLNQSTESLGQILTTVSLILYFAICMELTVYINKSIQNKGSEKEVSSEAVTNSKTFGFIKLSLSITSLLGFVVVVWGVGLIIYILVERNLEGYKQATEKYNKETLVWESVQKRVGQEVAKYVQKNCKQLNWDEAKKIEKRIEEEEFKKAGIIK